MQSDIAISPHHQDHDPNDISSSCSDDIIRLPSMKNVNIKANESNQESAELSPIKTDIVDFVVNKILLTLNDVQDQMATARNKPYSLNKMFNDIKLKIKFNSKLRKNKFDSIIKKTKAKLFKVIHQNISKCFHSHVKIERLPQLFITDLQINLNKEYLNQTLFSCYQKFGIFTDYDQLITDNILKADKVEIFKKFTQLTFEEFYEYYITSNAFREDLYHITEKSGVKFAVMYMFIMVNFVRYYKNGKGNIISKEKNDKKQRIQNK